MKASSPLSCAITISPPSLASASTEHSFGEWSPAKCFIQRNQIRRDGITTLQNETFALIWCQADFLKGVKISSWLNIVFQISSKCMHFTDPSFSSLATKPENLLFAQLWLWIICILGYKNDFKNIQKRTKRNKKSGTCNKQRTKKAEKEEIHSWGCLS